MRDGDGRLVVAVRRLRPARLSKHMRRVEHSAARLGSARVRRELPQHDVHRGRQRDGVRGWLYMCGAGRWRVEPMHW